MPTVQPNMISSLKSYRAASAAAAQQMPASGIVLVLCVNKLSSVQYKIISGGRNIYKYIQIKYHIHNKIIPDDKNCVAASNKRCRRSGILIGYFWRKL